MLLAVSLFAVLGSAWADEMTATDVTIQQGKTAVLKVELNNPGTAYAGFQFKLTLPDGVTATKIEKGERIADLNITVELKENQVLGYQTVTTAFPGTSGVVANITLQADASLASGNYVGKLTEVQIADPAENSYDLDDVTFTIAVSEPTEIVLDEASTTVPSATAGAEDLLVKRTLKANTWSTICLPFSMTEAQVKAAFGDDVQLAEFVDYEAEEVAGDICSITVNFDDVDLSSYGFEANFPYLIKVSSPLTEFTVTAKVEPDEDEAVSEYTNGKSGSRKEVYGTFKGVLHSGGYVPANDLFLSDNKFYYSTGISTIKAFRAYLNLVDVMPSSSASVAIRINEGTTRVEGLSTPAQTGNAYDLSGRKMLSDKNLEKGVYVIDGQKVVVK